MRSLLLPTFVLIACCLMMSCASSVPPASAPTKPQPAALMTQCPPIPAPLGGGIDAQAEHLAEVYALYGLCAGRYLELIKRQSDAQATANN